MGDNPTQEFGDVEDGMNAPGEAAAPEPPKKNPEDERYYARQEFLDIIARSPFKVDRIDTSLPKHALFILAVK